MKRASSASGAARTAGRSWSASSSTSSRVSTCFSHYVVAFFLAVTGYRLLLDDWRGYLISFFAVAGVANVYLSLFGRLRVDIKSERLDVVAKEEAIGGE